MHQIFKVHCTDFSVEKSVTEVCTVYSNTIPICSVSKNEKLLLYRLLVCHQLFCSKIFAMHGMCFYLRKSFWKSAQCVKLLMHALVVLVHIRKICTRKVFFAWWASMTFDLETVIHERVVVVPIESSPVQVHRVWIKQLHISFAEQELFDLQSGNVPRREIPHFEEAMGDELAESLQRCARLFPKRKQRII